MSGGGRLSVGNARSCDAGQAAGAASCRGAACWSYLHGSCGGPPNWADSSEVGRPGSAELLMPARGARCGDRSLPQSPMSVLTGSGCLTALLSSLRKCRRSASSCTEDISSLREPEYLKNHDFPCMTQLKM